MRSRPWDMTTCTSDSPDMGLCQHEAPSDFVAKRCECSLLNSTIVYHRSRGSVAMDSTKDPLGLVKHLRLQAIGRMIDRLHTWY